MTHKLGPKQRKGNDIERIQTKCPIPPPAKGPFAKPVVANAKPQVIHSAADIQFWISDDVTKNGL